MIFFPIAIWGVHVHVTRKFKHKFDNSLIDVTLRGNSIIFNVVVQVLDKIVQ
jgi:hypothetical protein